MSNIVTPGVSAGVQPPSTQPKSVAAGDAGATAGQAPAQGSAPTPRAADSVQLTASARAIESAASNTDVPVDAQRVADVREAIANGTYTVDAQRVAGRMISMEKQIG